MMRGKPGSVLTLTLEKLRKISFQRGASGNIGIRWEVKYLANNSFTALLILELEPDGPAGSPCLPICVSQNVFVVSVPWSESFYLFLFHHLRSVASCINKLAHTLIIVLYLAIGEADMLAEALIVLRYACDIKESEYNKKDFFPSQIYNFGF